MKACIMCGGAGTRLRPLTFERPKPSIPLLNKPSVGHLVDHLSANGFNDIVITLGYLGRNIKEYLEDGAKFGVEIHYIRERKKLGTAGALRTPRTLLTADRFSSSGGSRDGLQPSRVLSIPPKER